MKNIVEYFSNKGFIFKSCKNIDKTLLKTRKKVDIFSCTDIDKNYHCIFLIEQKSRFLVKNAEDLILLNDNLQQLEEHNFRYKHFIIKGTICSKSISFFKARGWQVYNDIM